MKLVYLILLCTSIISLIFSKKTLRNKNKKGIWDSLLKVGVKALNGYINPEGVKENKNTVPESKDMKKVKDEEKKKKENKGFNLMGLIQPLTGGKVDLTSVLTNALKGE